MASLPGPGEPGDGGDGPGAAGAPPGAHAQAAPAAATPPSLPPNSGSGLCPQERYMLPPAQDVQFRAQAQAVYFLRSGRVLPSLLLEAVQGRFVPRPQEAATRVSMRRRRRTAWQVHTAAHKAMSLLSLSGAVSNAFPPRPRTSWRPGRNKDNSLSTKQLS